MPLPPELFAAYMRTSFTARVGGGRELVIRIGRRHPEVDALLREASSVTGGVEASWAYITAWNPRSRGLSIEENRARQAAMIAMIDGRYAYFEGEGIAADGAWREPSLLILGIRYEEALALGQKFEQNAIVVGERGGAAELVLTRDAAGHA